MEHNKTPLESHSRLDTSHLIYSSSVILEGTRFSHDYAHAILTAQPISQMRVPMLQKSTKK